MEKKELLKIVKEDGWAVKQAGEDALEFADKSIRKDKDIVKVSKQK